MAPMTRWRLAVLEEENEMKEQEKLTEADEALEAWSEEENEDEYEEEEGVDSETEAETRRILNKYHNKLEKSYEEGEEYLKQLRESEGYDIDDHVVPQNENLVISYLPLEPECFEEEKPLLINLCESALDFYNNKKNNNKKKRPRTTSGGGYKFHSLAYATANMCGGFDYRFTFLVTPDDYDDDDTLVPFQANVFYADYGNNKPPTIKVISCNIKPPPVVKDVQVEGDAIEGNILKGVGHYVGGKQGPSILEWFRLNTKTRKRVLVMTSSAEYVLTKGDVGHRLIFKYTPVDSLGQEGKARSKWSQIVKQR